MAVAQGLFRVLSAQHVDHVGRAEALAGAVNAGKQFLRLHRAVPCFWGRQADVAVAAVVREVVPEVFQHGPASAGGDLAPAQQRVEFHPLDSLVFFARLGLVDQQTQPDHVLQSVNHPRFGGLTVAARTARFLVVGLHALGQVHMGHEADIGFVDAHAEGDGRHDDHAVLILEPGLIRIAGF